MKVNEALWGEVKKSIESHTEKDQSITDITIKFRIKENSDLRNYLQIKSDSFNLMKIGNQCNHICQFQNRITTSTELPKISQ